MEQGLIFTWLIYLSPDPTNGIPQMWDYGFGAGMAGILITMLVAAVIVLWRKLEAKEKMVRDILTGQDTTIALLLDKAKENTSHSADSKQKLDAISKRVEDVHGIIMNYLKDGS